MALVRYPGISVVHTALPVRRSGLVRCDVAGMIGFIGPDRWPEDAIEGDYLHLPVKRLADLLDHPLGYVFSETIRRSVKAFFDNGGLDLHLLGLCVQDPATQEWTGAADHQDGVLYELFRWLRGEEEVALLSAPDAAWLPCEYTRAGQVRCSADAFYDELLGHCREMVHRFLIIDPPRGLHGAPLKKWLSVSRDRLPERRGFGAVYYPWLNDRDRELPPSGAMLGIYSRVERQHRPFGVVWPPANVLVDGVTHAELRLGWEEAGEITAAGANPLVIQPGQGVRVFGARTLSRDPRWEYINTRRIVSMIAEQLRRDSEWAVFEHNSPGIWSVLVRDVSFRLDQLWEKGVLAPLPEQEKYRVQCDEETNTKEDREAGRLNVWVNLRPVGTTEHITIELRLGGRDVIGG